MRPECVPYPLTEYAVLAAYIANLLPGLGELEDTDDLPFGELTLAHN